MCQAGDMAGWRLRDLRPVPPAPCPPHSYPARGLIVSACVRVCARACVRACARALPARRGAPTRPRACARARARARRARVCVCVRVRACACAPVSVCVYVPAVPVTGRPPRGAVPLTGQGSPAVPCDAFHLPAVPAAPPLGSAAERLGLGRAQSSADGHQTPRQNRGLGRGSGPGGLPGRIRGLRCSLRRVRRGVGAASRRVRCTLGRQSARLRVRATPSIGPRPRLTPAAGRGCRRLHRNGPRRNRRFYWFFSLALGGAGSPRSSPRKGRPAAAAGVVVLCWPHLACAGDRAAVAACILAAAARFLGRRGGPEPAP